MTEELEQARDEAKEAALKLTNHHEEMKEKMHDLTLKSQDLIDQNARLRAVVKTFEDYVEELEEREARLEMYQSKLVGAKETITEWRHRLARAARGEDLQEDNITADFRNPVRMEVFSGTQSMYSTGLLTRTAG